MAGRAHDLSSSSACKRACTCHWRASDAVDQAHWQGADGATSWLVALAKACTPAGQTLGAWRVRSHSSRPPGANHALMCCCSLASRGVHRRTEQTDASARRVWSGRGLHSSHEALARSAHPRAWPENAPCPAAPGQADRARSLMPSCDAEHWTPGSGPSSAQVCRYKPSHCTALLLQLRQRHPLVSSKTAAAARSGCASRSAQERRLCCKARRDGEDADAQEQGQARAQAVAQARAAHEERAGASGPDVEGVPPAGGGGAAPPRPPRAPSRRCAVPSRSRRCRTRRASRSQRTRTCRAWASFTAT